MDKDFTPYGCRVQVELTALSVRLERCIEVVQAEGAPVVVGEQWSDGQSRLLLSYHRHMYGLGEHYNAVLPVN